MKALIITEYGEAENLAIADVPDPEPAGGLLVRVRAAGINRADILQRRGLYPPPAGVSEKIPGLEFAGDVVESDSPDFRPGDRVFGITSGEAQSELLRIDPRLVATVPDNLSYTGAAAVPEAFITAHDALFTIGRLSQGEAVLIHAVGSGVGLAAAQLAKVAGATVIGTSRTIEKAERARSFGADYAISTSAQTAFAAEVKKLTGGRGVDLILDLVGAVFFAENLGSLALKGRLVLVGLTGGAKAEFDLRTALQKRLQITGTVLRSRSIEEKAEAVRLFVRDVLPLLAAGRVRPVVDRVFKFTDAAEAHRYVESNRNFGKVVLEW